MKQQTVAVFHELMKKGWIDRSENAVIWQAYGDADVREELATLEEGLNCELIQSGNRVYLVPTQENDLFLKNNIDFRRDISADKDVKTRDLYLLNYLSIYLIYLFYHGEGADPKCREFISREDAIQAFSKHCKACVSSTDIGTERTDYSENFIQLANAWLSKTDGAMDSRKFGEKYGMLNRILIKFGKDRDDLFYVEAGVIRPTRKLDNLMPYFLRKERIAEIQNWIAEVNANAANHEA